MNTTMRKQRFLFLGFLLAISIICSPALGLQDSDPKQEPKSEQKQDENKKQDDEKKSDDNKKADEKEKRKKQLRTGTQRLGRMLPYSRASNEMVAVLGPVAASASQSTATVYSGKEQVALGVIVSDDGFILTKASQLDDKLRVFAAGQSFEAEVVGIHKKSDLAMLKVDAENLPVANFTTDGAPRLGSWLASAGPDEDPFAVGVVAVESRRISGSRAFVGIMPVQATDREGVRIDSVTPDSPADRADLLVNDVITKIDKAVIKNPNDLRSTLAKYEAGDRVELTVVRGDKELKIGLELAAFGKFNPQFERSNQQNRMGSKLSQRRRDFPMAFQHDSGLNANQCGGPLVDLSGRIVGINIARAERVSSLALPVPAILPVIEELKSGELSPSVVNQPRIAEIDAQIAKIKGQLDGLPEKQMALRLKVDVQEARREELTRMIEELQNRLENLDTDKDQKDELNKLKKEIFTFKRRIKKLESEKKDLMNGVVK